MLYPLAFAIIGIFSISFLSVTYAEEIITIHVAPELVDCVGVAKQKCMQVRYSDDSEWKMFYDQIEGFTFESGKKYELRVLVSDIKNPPADASSKKYSLLEIIEEKKPNRHIPYNGICAPGFTSLGEICVLNDRCGPGAYPGKVCTMDGEIQPYLRPLQQGNAGIAASDVICAEGLTLLFKSSDGSPSCVRDSSVDSLKERGFQEVMPNRACTLEYAPVCGIDGVTYGNMCMINAKHIAVKHTGECLDATLTEFELDTKYQEAQNKISKVSKELYNGRYNGNLPLDQALKILQDGRAQLAALSKQYSSLDDELKTDMQIAMRFSTLGKMGLSSIDSQINMIKNQIENPSPDQSPEDILAQAEKSFSVKFNAISNVIKNYESSFENGTYVGVMFAESMRKSIYESQQKVFELYDDLDAKKEMISEELYSQVEDEVPKLDASVKDMWKTINEHLDKKGVTFDALRYTWQAPEIDSEKNYFVDEIADGVYWLVSSGYQTMFVVTGEGVVVIDAPQPIGEKYLDAVSEVTTEPITHMIYSHHHQDHTGAAGQIFPADITYISHQGTADVLKAANDPNRPVPTVAFSGELEILNIGDKTIELHHLGNFHSDGDILIILPEQNVAMIVDLLRPDAAPYRAFGVTPDIDLYVSMHDKLQDYDFDVLVSGHTGILATKDHIKTNKEFTLDVMNNAADSLGDESPVDSCVAKTVSQWQGKLDGLDTFMTEHCQAMIDYHNSS